MDNGFLFFPLQSKLVMEGFRSLKEGEQVEFTYKKSSKGLESLRVTGPGGGPCAGSERRPKGKVPLQKRKPKGDRWVSLRDEQWNWKQEWFLPVRCLWDGNNLYTDRHVNVWLAGRCRLPYSGRNTLHVHLAAVISFLSGLRL